MLGTLALSLFLSWVQASSNTYIVKSSAGAERAKRVLKEPEYFATADIRADAIALGGLPADRMQLLKTASLLPLATLFNVGTSSPYYNESAKANIFYVQAWAFVHYMMHGKYAPRFKKYVDA